MSDQDTTNSKTKSNSVNRRNMLLAGTTFAAASALSSVTSLQAQAQAPSGQRPNIIFIMGDDIGWFNVGAYHRGIMAGRTPNLDRYLKCDRNARAKHCGLHKSPAKA
jgi:arylsulfatase